MRAAQLLAPSLLATVTVSAPEPEALAEGEVIVRVSAASICGSDIPHFLRGDPPTEHPGGGAGYPLHEIMGQVSASRSADLEVGRQVVGWASRMDGLAEFVVTDASQLAICELCLPPWEAVVAQPLACVLFAVSRLGNVADKNVAVIGLGPIGLLFCHVLSNAGARSVTGIDIVDRSEVASEYGVTQFVHGSSSDWVRNLNESRRPEILIEAVGHQPATLRDAIGATAKGGTIYCFGIPALAEYPVDLSTVVGNNLTVIGGRTLDRRRSLEQACRYMTTHPKLASAMVTHVLPIDDAQRAYDVASRPAPGRLKVVLVPTHDPLTVSA